MEKYNNFNTKCFILSICLLFVFVSCTDNFDEYNTHPTDLSPDELTVAERVGTLFPGMLYLMHNSQENDNQMIEQMVGNQYGGYMATTNKWQGTNFGTFNPPAGWIEYPFNKLFTDFYSNYLKIKEITEGKGYIYAWANIIRVNVMLRVTDIYGPIPYSQMGNGLLTVEYDSVQSVYHYMINDLNNSIASLTAFNAENKGRANPMSEFDPVYNGDFSKWIKFANSIKFRMAVRIGLVDENYAKSVMAEAIAGGCIEDNSDNAFLPTVDNPYRKSAFDWGDLAIGATLSAYMNGWEDPRRDVYMTRTEDGKYRGVRMGIQNIDKETYSNYKVYSKPNFAANSPMLVYCAAETYFLKAEAALRGWIQGGETEAKAQYEAGIQISFKQHGVEGSFATYIAGKTAPERYTDPTTNVNAPSYITGATVAWSNTSSTTDYKLEKIISQKWLANYPLGLEAWNDFRRTGYPRLYPALNNLSSASTGGSVNNPTNNLSNTANLVRMARRLPYPVSEYNGNPVNVQYAVDNLLGGTDEFSTDIWWAKKQ
ncbi:MAG: SusD/RagB family nutrient-binding outer membrane lipoprotein [Dysgonamonadaceae bacterium]|jgi:hypothetical protein|nr:SusD/RagB family nutrient-binding outer membrane lipoprotein [Dysgonamonadaceae bacterium]